MAQFIMLLPQTQINANFLQPGAQAIDISRAGRIAFQFFSDGFSSGDGASVVFHVQSATSKSDDQFLDTGYAGTLEYGTNTIIVSPPIGTAGPFGSFVRLRIVTTAGTGPGIFNVRCQVNLMNLGR